MHRALLVNPMRGDIGKSGWWLLIALSIIGIIVLIVWACQKSDAGPNAYGPEPVTS